MSAFTFSLDISYAGVLIDGGDAGPVVTIPKSATLSAARI